MAKNPDWSSEELALLRKIGGERVSFKDWVAIARRFPGRTATGCRIAYDRLVAERNIPESPYRRYDSPPVTEGDCLVLPDLEAPFHHAGFVNNCLELARSSGIKNLVLAGDALHFDSLSAWEPSWSEPAQVGPTEEQKRELEVYLLKLPAKERDEALEKLDSMGLEQTSGKRVSEELQIARDIMGRLAKMFDEVTYILGNHEGRLLRALQSPLFPQELMRLLETGNWKTGPYYYSIIKSGGQEWQVEHPRSAAKIAAKRLANKYKRNILMAHSHKMLIETDDSGQYWAYTIGACVDESRLPYASQRHTTQAEPHMLGACIINDGHGWLLHERSDWDRLAKALA